MPRSEEIAFISSASEMIAPRNRIVSRSSPFRIFPERVAGSDGSSSGYTTWAVISAGIPSRIARRNGTSSRSRRVFLPAGTNGSSLWESVEVSPCPGKCFPTARIPRDISPAANAMPRRPASSGSEEKDRSPITGFSGFETTSSTGAKSTSIPATRSSAPIASPRAPAISALRRPNREQARAGGNSVYGGFRNRATRPPSWSTAISGDGVPGPAAARISRHSERT